MAHHTKRLFISSQLLSSIFIGGVYGLWAANFAKMIIVFRQAYCLDDCVKTPFTRIFAASYLCRNYHQQTVFYAELKRKTKQTVE